MIYLYNDLFTFKVTWIPLKKKKKKGIFPAYLAQCLISQIKTSGPGVLPGSNVVPACFLVSFRTRPD